jgi:hypothetical protein
MRVSNSNLNTHRTKRLLSSPFRPRALPPELFFEYRGRLMMSGSVPREFSYYMNGGPSIGGFFTNQLIAAITKSIESRGPNVSWEEIAADATKPIPIPGVSNQHPQFAAHGLERDAVPVAATGSFK